MKLRESSTSNSNILPSSTVTYNSSDGLYYVHLNAEDNSTATYELSTGQARSLIRQLVDAGVEMSFPDKSYTAGELDATKQHLNDLRRIVFEDKQ